MWSLLAVCFVAFVMHPTPAMSYWCEAKSCNTINNNVNTLETSVFQLHDSLERQQQLQQKQQEKLNQTLYTQLAILKETVEQQQKQIQKQDRQLTTLGKTGEQQQKELKQAEIQYRNQIQQLKEQILTPLNSSVQQLQQQQQQQLQKTQLETLKPTVEKQQKRLNR